VNGPCTSQLPDASGVHVQGDPPQSGIEATSTSTLRDPPDVRGYQQIVLLHVGFA